MQAIFRREMPIPDHVDMFLVSREMAACDENALKVFIVTTFRMTKNNHRLHA